MSLDEQKLCFSSLSFGYVLIATFHSIGHIAAGKIFYAFGYTGLQMLQQIIIADLTSLRWRFVAGMEVCRLLEV